MGVVELGVEELIPKSPRDHAPYMEWAKTRAAAAFDLAGSNILACTLEDDRFHYALHVMEKKLPSGVPGQSGS